MIPNHKVKVWIYRSVKNLALELAKSQKINLFFIVFGCIIKRVSSFLDSFEDIDLINQLFSHKDFGLNLSLILNSLTVT